MDKNGSKFSQTEAVSQPDHFSQFFYAFLNNDKTSTMVRNHSIVGPMVHNHWKPSLSMVVLSQKHRKTIDPNGCVQPLHSMVMVTLKTIESLRW